MAYKPDKIVERATRAIRAVRDDPSATLEQVLDTLKLLRDGLNMLIANVEEIIRRENPAESIDGYYDGIYDRR